MFIGMTNLDTPKKPALQDWHPADIVALLRKAGWTLRRLSVKHGYHPSSLQVALRAPWPKAEKIIAMAVGKRPQQIWPSRYNQSGTPNRLMGRPKLSFKDSKQHSGCNVKTRRAA